MAEIGYARVSTHEQNLDMQHDELHRAGVTTIYEDRASGKTADRPELQHCLKALREGDTLTVWRLDRLGRNLQDLIRIVSDLESRGVTFKSLKETIDTRGPAGKLVFHLFAALAQFERELLRERTLSGLAAARARGFHGGRPQRQQERGQTKPALPGSTFRFRRCRRGRKSAGVYGNVAVLAPGLGVPRGNDHSLASKMGRHRDGRNLQISLEMDPERFSTRDGSH